MAEKEKDLNQETSMDDILASIRKILADDEPESLQEESEDENLKDVVFDQSSKITSLILDEDEPLDLTEEVLPNNHQGNSSPHHYKQHNNQASGNTEMDSKVLSPQTIESANQALSKLNEVLHPSAPSSTGLTLQNAVTLESLVQKSLEPILKEWLEQNLSHVIENIVAKEIKKVIRQATDN